MRSAMRSIIGSSSLALNIRANSIVISSKQRIAPLGRGSQLGLIIFYGGWHPLNIAVVTKELPCLFPEFLRAACNDQSDGCAIVFRDPKTQMRFLVIRWKIDVAINERRARIQIKRLYVMTHFFQLPDQPLDITSPVDRKAWSFQCCRI